MQMNITITLLSSIMIYILIINSFEYAYAQEREGRDEDLTKIYRKPPGMTDRQYRQVINTMKAKQMSEPDRNAYWMSIVQGVTNLVQRILSVRDVAKRIGDFFTRVSNAAGSTGAIGGTIGSMGSMGAPVG